VHGFLEKMINYKVYKIVPIHLPGQGTQLRGLYDYKRVFLTEQEANEFIIANLDQPGEYVILPVTIV
jgi:hypothetical protein